MKATLEIVIKEDKKCGLYDLFFTYVCEHLDNSMEFLNKSKFNNWVKSKGFKDEVEIIKYGYDLIDRYKITIDTLDKMVYPINDRRIDIYP